MVVDEFFVYLDLDNTKYLNRIVDMNENNTEVDLIKRLLSDKLDEQERKKVCYSNLIEKQMKKQWMENKNTPVDDEIGEKMWNTIENRCTKVSYKTLPSKLWYIVAFVALFLIVGTLWMNFTNDPVQVNKYIEVTAQEGRMYLLPDSSKVWMQPGSSIKFAEDFNNHRKVWLKGNSLFEVSKKAGKHFRVYIDKAFVEVKGTSFLINQNSPTANKIILFNGNIEFNIESTHKKIKVNPLQTIVYNSVNAETQLRQTENIEWKDGRYNFKQYDLEHLIKIINQMYSSHVVISDKVNKSCAFTGSIRYDESLEDIIDKICFSLSLRSKNTNKEIIIYN